MLNFLTMLRFVMVRYLYLLLLLPLCFSFAKAGQGKLDAMRTVIQQGHTDDISQVAYSKDGRLFFTVAKDRSLKIWNRDGTLLRTISLPQSGRYWLKSYEQGRRVVVGLANRVLVFDTETGHVIKKLSGHDIEIKLCDISEDGKTIITSNGYQHFQIRNRDWQVTQQFDNAMSSSINDITLSPDNKTFVVAGSSQNSKTSHYISAKLYDIKGNLLGNIEESKPTLSSKKLPFIKEVQQVIFSPDGKLIALLSDYGNQVHMRTSSGQLAHQLNNNKQSSLQAQSIHFTPDGLSIWVAEARNAVKYNLDGKKITRFKLVTSRDQGSVASFALSPDGKQFLAGYRWGRKSAKGRVAIWQTDGTLAKSLSLPAITAMDVSMPESMDKIILSLKRGQSSLIVSVKDFHSLKVKETIGYFSNGDEYGLKYQRNREPMIFRDTQGTHKLTLPSGHYPIPTPQGNLAVIHWPGGEINIFKSNGELDRQLIYNRHGRGLPDAIVMSPDERYFVIEQGTSNGGYFAVELFDMQTSEELADFEVEKAFSSIAVSQDGQKIAIGHEDGDISVWNEKGKKLANYHGHKGKVQGMRFTLDDRFLITVGHDRTIRLFETNGTTRLTILLLEDGEWLVFDQNGRFDSSNGGRQYVRFVQGTQYLDLRQAWDLLFTPGLLESILQGKSSNIETPTAYIAAVPEVSIESVGKESNDGRAVLNVCTKDKQKTGNVFLLHNGRTVQTRGLQIAKRKHCRQFVIDLLDGKNELVGAAYNQQNTLYGRSSAITFAYQPPQLTKPKLFILSTGVSQYHDANLQLLYAADDAYALADSVSSIAKELYGEIEQHVLVDAKATRANILQSMQQIQENSNVNDTIVIFWAGHGDTIDSVYYYLGYDADITDLADSAISINDLKEFTKNVKANKIVILLDTCKSGQVTKDLQKIAFARGLEERKMIATLSKERGIAVFSAASQTQSAFEIESLGHGIFTYSLVETLNQNPQEVANGKLISVAKLLSFVNRKTRDLAVTHLNVAQHPILYMFGDDFSLGLLK